MISPKLASSIHPSAAAINIEIRVTTMGLEAGSPDRGFDICGHVVRVAVTEMIGDGRRDFLLVEEGVPLGSGSHHVSWGNTLIKRACPYPSR